MVEGKYKVIAVCVDTSIGVSDEVVLVVLPCCGTFWGIPGVL